MPRNMRYFPVNQDINTDPEMWELREIFGDRAGFVWFEILSIAERNSGELPGAWKDYPRLLAGRCKSTTRHLQGVCQWLTRWLIVDSQGVARVRNYEKYHRLRGENRHSPNLTKPNLTKPNLEEKNKRAQAPLVELPEWLPMDPWNGFCEYRKRIRKPLTQRAVYLAIGKLIELRAKGNDPAAVLDQSVANGWTGLFEIKQKWADNGQRANRNEPKGFDSVRGFLALHKK